MANDSFGQIFITDARPERINELLKQIEREVLFFEVENGEIER